MALNVVIFTLTASNVKAKDAGIKSTYQVTTPIGGNGGSWFNDCSAKRGPINQINVRTGRFIDNIRVSYGKVFARKHGGQGGSSNNCTLMDGEQIVMVRGRYGRVIDQIEFVTNEGRKCGPYGGRGGLHFSKSIPGYHLSCITGRAGRLIDQIAFVWEEDGHTQRLPKIESIVPGMKRNPK